MTPAAAQPVPPDAHSPPGAIAPDPPTPQRPASVCPPGVREALAAGLDAIEALLALHRGEGEGEHFAADEATLLAATRAIPALDEAARAARALRDSVAVRRYAYELGTPVADIAAAAGYTDSMLCRLAAAAGVPRRAARRVSPPGTGERDTKP